MRRKPSVLLMFLPHFDVFCDLLLNRRTATWNLFVFLIAKQTTTDKAFLSSKSFNESRPLPTFWRARKKPFEFSIQNEAISLVAIRSEGL